MKTHSTALSLKQDASALAEVSPESSSASVLITVLGFYAQIHENFRPPKTYGLLPVNPRQNSLQINRIVLASEGIVPQEMQVLPRRR